MAFKEYTTTYPTSQDADPVTGVQPDLLNDTVPGIHDGDYIRASQITTPRDKLHAVCKKVGDNSSLPSGSLMNRTDILLLNSLSSSFNVRSAPFSATGNGSTDDSTAIQYAINWIAAKGGGTLYFPSGSYKCTSALTSSTSVNFHFDRGGILNLAATSGISFKGFFNAGLYQVFTGSGRASFEYGSVIDVYPQWWGAIADGGTDCTIPFRKAVSSLSDIGGSISLSNGYFKLTAPVTVTNGIHIFGTGTQSTIIQFAPLADGPAFRVWSGTVDVITGYVTIEKMTIQSLDVTLNKIGIQLIDGDRCYFKDIIVTAWTGGTGSIGMDIRGRQLCQVGRYTAYADYPIQINHRPRTADNGTGLLDCDSFHFYDMTLVPSKPDNYAFTVYNAAHILNLSIDGSNNVSLGSGIFYWRNTATCTGGSSANIAIRNIRWEQCQEKTYGIDIGGYGNYQILGLLLDTVSVSEEPSGGQGYKFTGSIHDVSMVNCQYLGTSSALNVDNVGAQRIKMDNCFFLENSTVSKAGMDILFGVGNYPTTSPLPPSCVLGPKDQYAGIGMPVTSEQKWIYLNGAKHAGITKTMAYGTVYNLVCTEGMLAGTLTLAAYYNGPAIEGAIYYCGANLQPIALTASAGFVVGLATDGKINVGYAAPYIKIVNYMKWGGAPVTAYLCGTLDWSLVTDA